MCSDVLGPGWLIKASSCSPAVAGGPPSRCAEPRQPAAFLVDPGAWEPEPRPLGPEGPPLAVLGWRDEGGASPCAPDGTACPEVTLREQPSAATQMGKTAKEEQEARTLYLRSLQYLERYIFLILFNAYLHLEKPGSWQRPFSVWMLEVAAKAGVYEILNHLGFTEFEAIEDRSLSRLRYRWQERTLSPGPFLGDFL